MLGSPSYRDTGTGYIISQMPDGSSGPAWQAEWATDAPKMYVKATVGAGVITLIQVDGEWIFREFKTWTSGGQDYEISYLTRKVRRSKIKGTNSLAVTAIVVGTSDVFSNSKRDVNTKSATRLTRGAEATTFLSQSFNILR